jgi:hypothetical protein
MILDLERDFSDCFISFGMSRLFSSSLLRWTFAVFRRFGLWLWMPIPISFLVNLPALAYGLSSVFTIVFPLLDLSLSCNGLFPYGHALSI